MKCFTAILALASLSSTLSVNVVGYLRRNYDNAAAAVEIMDSEEPQAREYAPLSVFAEKKKEADEAQKKFWYWTEVEGCEECKKFKDEVMNATTELGKKKAKKYFDEAAAATLRAASHLSDEGMTAWLTFQEKYGAEKAERLADKWLKRHASSYDEDAFDDVDLAALEKGLKPDPEAEIIVFCDFYPGKS
mmetsp:Transcript_15298/g.25017  ORF Transcript_15298/g.25017 Transcript_15298/m.25017 type:complete len:190 (-) Transcript_15298:361-930(-)